MRLGVLCSGGKDSLYACFRAMQAEEVVCLITIVPANPESYMFHTPNLHVVPLQATAAGLPLVSRESRGEKEEELIDLAGAISAARESHGIEGVVSGALMSVYQSSRVQRVCRELDLWCFNPLWYYDPRRYMGDLVASGFSVVISAVCAEPFDESWLGRRLDRDALSTLEAYSRDFGISLAGEGGEYETLVLDTPFFRKRIVIEESDTRYGNFRGSLCVTRARLEEK
ncbi:MAG: diphthine--ammonia ligase [Methanolinea sp.]|nr:diphthine--ammonia ligase [Methanolinea sp.]